MNRLSAFLVFLVGGAAILALRFAMPSSDVSLVDLDLHLFSGSNARESRDEGPRGFSGSFPVAQGEYRASDNCFPAEVIEGARVVALGAYEAETETPYYFASESDEVGRLAVQADAEGEPLLLVLSAHSPIIWDFTAFPIDRLRGVLAYGFGPQAVANLDEDVPIHFVTRSSEHAQCGEAIAAYKYSEEMLDLREQVPQILGAPLRAFYGHYSPVALNADGKDSTALALDPLEIDQIRASEPLLTDGLFPGKRGVRQLIDRGALRPARNSDWALWKKRFGKIPSRSGFSSYVILEATEIPHGMHGAHSATFIIPEGVPMPDDPGSHNEYYRLADGSCMGCF